MRSAISRYPLGRMALGLWFLAGAACGDGHGSSAPKAASGAPGGSAATDRKTADIVKLILPEGGTAVSGFDDVRTGMSRAAVEELCGPLAPSPDERGWLVSRGDRNFRFSDGRLVFYIRGYRGDNDRWIKHLIGVVGKPNRSDVYQAALAAEAETKQTLVSWYYFSETVMVIQADWIQRRFGHQEAVWVHLFDRRWLGEVLASEVHRKRLLLEWALTAMAQAEGPEGVQHLATLPQSTLNKNGAFVALLPDPPLPDEVPWPRLSAPITERGRDGTAITRPRRSIATVILLGPQNDLSLYDPIRDTPVYFIGPGPCQIKLDLSCRPDPDAAGLPYLGHLTTSLNLALAKEYLRAIDGEYRSQRANSALYPDYCWRGDNGWSFRLTRGNLLLMLRDPAAAKFAP